MFTYLYSALKSNIICCTDTVRITAERREAIVVVKDIESFPDRKDRQEGNIDVWWVVHDGGMMILMMFLLRQHKTWRKCNLRIFTVARILSYTIRSYLYHISNDFNLFHLPLLLKPKVPFAYGYF